MATKSKETQAREQRQQIERKRKSDAIKARKSDAVNEALKSVSAGKVIPLEQQSGVKDAPKYETKAKLGPVGYLGATGNNKPANRKYDPSQAQLDYTYD